MDDSQKIIEEQYAKLPSDIKEAIKSVDSPSKLGAITKRHMLHIDQADSLENETLFVMLGLEDPTDFINNLEKELEVSKEKAQAIAQDINENIFNPIKESLKKIHEHESEEIEKEEAAAKKSEETSSKPSASITDPDPLLMKENILKGIEDPSPTAPMANAPSPTTSMQSKLDKLSENLEIQSAPETPKIQSAIMEDKLSGMTKLPKEEIVIESKAPEAPVANTPPVQKVDPYRESIM